MLTLALRTGRRERIWCRLELEQYNCSNLVYDTLDNATIFPILVSVHQYCLSGAKIDTSTFVVHMHRAGYPLLIRTVPSDRCQRKEENLVNNKFPSDHEGSPEGTAGCVSNCSCHMYAVSVQYVSLESSQAGIIIRMAHRRCDRRCSSS
jgi:hypothetical protein